jgi:hypothetical protein
LQGNEVHSKQLPAASSLQVVPCAVHQISEELNRSGANIRSPMALSWQSLSFTDSKICPDSTAAIDKFNTQVSKNPRHLIRHVQNLLAVLPASTLAQVSPTTSRDIAVTVTVILTHFESMMAGDKRQALFHECFRRVTFGVLLLIQYFDEDKHFPEFLYIFQTLIALSHKHSTFIGSKKKWKGPLTLFGTTKVTPVHATREDSQCNCMFDEYAKFVGETRKRHTPVNV